MQKICRIKYRILILYIVKTNLYPIRLLLSWLYKKKKKKLLRKYYKIRTLDIGIVAIPSPKWWLGPQADSNARYMYIWRGWHRGTRRDLSPTLPFHTVRADTRFTRIFIDKTDRKRYRRCNFATTTRLTNVDISVFAR